MNEYAKAANKIYTEDFLIFLDTIPKTKKEAKDVLTVANDVAKLLNKKRLSTCLLALTYYISSMLVDNDVDFDRAMDDIRQFRGEVNSEKYIQ